MQQGLSVRSFLSELDAPAAALRPVYQELQENFIAAADPLVELVVGARRRTAGESAFAVRQLLVRSLNDVVAAFHLLVHGYVNQGYSTLRMAYEATDVIELVATNSEQAVLWVNSSEAWRDFRPSKVRELLAKPEFDVFYGHLCEMSHPRFSAAHVTGYRVGAESDESVPTIILRMGPFMIDDHPAVPLALGCLATVLGLVVLRASHLAVAGEIDEQTWEDALDRSMAAQERFVTGISELLREAGLEGSDELVALYVNRPRLSTMGEDT